MPTSKSIESPEKLWELFNEFISFTENNPRKEHDFVGKDATEVYRKKPRPITWSGFEAWLAKKDVLMHLGHYEQNTDGAYTEYLPIIRAIKIICRGDVIEGALSNLYNANIAARIEGLKDSTEAKTDGKLEVVVKYEKRNNPS